MTFFIPYAFSVVVILYANHNTVTPAGAGEFRPFRWLGFEHAISISVIAFLIWALWGTLTGWVIR